MKIVSTNINKKCLTQYIMEAMTHNLTGVFIQILCFMYFAFPFNILFTILFAFLSHYIVDTFATLTYHTPEALKDDKFWVVWHWIILVLSIFSLIIFFIPYFLGMLFANFVDIWDWLILRPIQNKKKKENPDTEWGKKYFLHQGVDFIREKVPPFSWLPNWNYKRPAIITEIIILVILVILITFLILLNL